MATAVGAYEVEIITGTGVDEDGVRAKLNLFSEQEGGRLGRIYFYGPDETLEGDFVDRGSNPVLHLHTDMLSSVLDLLNSEKPLFVEFTEQRGRLKTTEDFVL